MLQCGISIGAGTTGAGVSYDSTTGIGESYDDTSEWRIEAGVSADRGGFSAGVGGSIGIENKYRGVTKSVGVGSLD